MYYYFSGLMYAFSFVSAEIWFSVAMLAPLFGVATSVVLFWFADGGKIITAYRRAKRFFKKERFLTSDNKDSYYNRCIKKLPGYFKKLNAFFPAASFLDRQSTLMPLIISTITLVPLCLMILTDFFQGFGWKSQLLRGIGAAGFWAVCGAVDRIIVRLALPVAAKNWKKLVKITADGDITKGSVRQSTAKIPS